MLFLDPPQLWSATRPVPIAANTSTTVTALRAPEREPSLVMSRSVAGDQPRDQTPAVAVTIFASARAPRSKSLGSTSRLSANVPPSVRS